MRSPSVHKLLGIGNKAGLSLLLAGHDNILELVRETSVRNLSAIAAGPHPPSAAELLSTDRFSVLLERMLEHFDHVVVDSPPILGLADAPLIGQAVEGAVLVIEAESASIRSIRNALRRMLVGQNQIFGAVVTKLDIERAGHDYGLNYAYYYSYGDEQKSEGKTGKQYDFGDEPATDR